MFILEQVRTNESKEHFQRMTHVLQSLYLWNNEDFSPIDKSSNFSVFSEIFGAVMDNAIRIVLQERQIAANRQQSHKTIQTFMYHGSSLALDSLSIKEAIAEKYLIFTREVIRRKDFYLLPHNLDTVEPLSEERFNTISFDEMKKEMTFFNFFCISLYRQPPESVDPEWREYMKQSLIYYHKRGYWRVHIDRLKKKGLLDIGRMQQGAQEVDAEAQQLVQDFDQMLNPLFTYFSKYEGVQKQLDLQSLAKIDDGDYDESLPNPSELPKEADLNEQTGKVLELLMHTVHRLSFVKRSSGRYLGQVVLTQGRMHCLKNRAAERYILQMEELCK